MQVQIVRVSGKGGLYDGNIPFLFSSAVRMGSFIAMVRDGGINMDNLLARLAQARQEGIGQVFMDGMAKAHLAV